MDRIERIRQSFIPRKADPSDTHDYIQRQDPDFHKNNHNHKKDNPVHHEDDLADVSIESLIIFLEGLLKDTTEYRQDQSEKPVNESMKKAISAYGGHKTKTPVKRYTYLDDDDQDYDPDMVKNLIDNLISIQTNGYAHITLLKDAGFLESIQKTVEKIQSID